MPDANGKIKGHGWSRSYGDAYERIFGNAATQRPFMERGPDVPDLMAALEASLSRAATLRSCTDRDATGRPRCRAGWSCSCVPSEPSPEVPPDCNGCGEDGHTIGDCPEFPDR